MGNPHADSGGFAFLIHSDSIHVPDAIQAGNGKAADSRFHEMTE